VRLHGLLLAAGAGSRLGRPKALVVDGDRSWLRHGVEVLAEGGCAGVTVVLGAAAEEARPLLDGLEEVVVVVAADWAAGMSASLRAGLTAAADTQADAVLVSLVDLPDLTAEVVRRVAAAGNGPGALARATYDGTPGHPVLMGRDHWPAVLANTSGDQGARDYLSASGAQGVECGDLATGRDVDRP
jgi:CTP:molybdopterin cytidylyltransferase MocA